MKFQETYEILSHYVDCRSVATPSHTLRLMQETANHQMRDRGPTYQELFDQGKAFVLVRISYELYAPLRQYHKVKVSTWNGGERGATFFRCYQIEEDGEVLAKAYSEWAVADRIKGGLCRTSEIDISNYEKDDLLNLDIPKKFHFSKGTEFSVLGKKTVRYGDVDMNFHMNNTNYPDMLWERIPGVEEKQFTSVNLRFRREAHLGMNIRIGMAEISPKLSGDPRAEEVYGFRTMVESGVNVEAMIGMCRAPER